MEPKTSYEHRLFKNIYVSKKIKVQLASYQSNGYKGVNVAPTPFQDGI